MNSNAINAEIKGANKMKKIGMSRINKARN